MPTIYIDGAEYDVGEGRNVLQAALDNKLDLPYFCWHPEMGSVGACRLCAIKHYRDENDERGRLAMGCMTPATEGTRVAIGDPEAAQFRRSVIEWLMINHPHDCPVCDEGGECHLQDMTVMTGHAHRRYRGGKRTYRNQYLGPLIHHEMNRCIQCYRCVRFYCDHSGGDDLGAFASRNRVYFGRVQDGVLESPFAGNLVEVCPTGVFTDKTLRRHYTRKWDLQQAPSVCTHCGLGCNTLMGSRYGSVRRVTSRYNGEVNRYWLCDRGRFGYEHLNADDRLRAVQAPRRDGEEMNVDAQRLWNEACDAVAAAREAGGLAAVGSPRASLETNFALRTLAGTARFCAGIAEPERRLISRYAASARRGRFHVPSLRQIEDAEAIVVIGTDPTNEAPLLDLALYRAHDAGKATIHFVGLDAGRLEGFATAVERRDVVSAAARVEQIAAAVADGNTAEPLAAALVNARTVLLITGTQHRSRRLLDATLELAAALHARRGVPPWVTMAVPEANSMGAALLDDEEGLSIPELVDAIEGGRVTTLVVAENDLFGRCDNGPRLAEALRRLDALIVLDHAVTPTSALASHAFPVAAAAESNGTVVSNEGRMQRFYQVLRPAGGAPPAWSLARDLFGAVSAGGADWQHFEDLTAELEAKAPVFRGAMSISPPAGFRHERQRIPRMSTRFSGRNASAEPDALQYPTANSRGEPSPPPRPAEDLETPFAFSMEGYAGQTDPGLISQVWSPGWNSNEAINQFQIEVGGPLHGGDPGVRIFNGAGGAAADRRPGRGTPPGLDGGGPAGADDAASSEVGQVLTGKHSAVASRRGPGTSDSTEANDPAIPESGVTRFLVCAAAEIFGSEQTSRRARALAELVPDCYLRVHPQSAAALGLVHDEVRRFELEGDGVSASFEATVVIDATRPARVLTVPFGYPATRWWQEPIWMRLRADEAVS